MKHLFWICLLVFSMRAGFAGDSGQLTLKEALELAEQNNCDIALAEANLDEVKGQHLKSLSILLPQVTLSETFIRTNDPLNVFGLKLKQESVSQADFNPVILNNPDPLDNFASKIEIRQPLINLDGWFGRSSSGFAVRGAESRKLRTRHYIAFEVKRSYFQLVLANESLRVIETAIHAATAGRDQAVNFFSQGLIHKSDVLFAEVRLLELENRKLDIENSIINAADHLRLLTGLHHSQSLVPVDTLDDRIVEPIVREAGSISEYRSDLAAMQWGIRASERLHRMNQATFLPDVNAFGSYELNDGTALGGRGRNWMVGVILNWNILSGFDQIGELKASGAKIEQARLAFHKASETSRNELESAYRSVRMTAQGLLLAKKAVAQSEENWRILSDRYGKGMDRITDLLSAEASLAEARLRYLESKFRYTTSLFMIEFLTEQPIQ